MKNDPKLVAAARELRDRYLERVNGEDLLVAGNARYAIYGLDQLLTSSADQRPIRLDRALVASMTAIPTTS